MYVSVWERLVMYALFVMLILTLVLLSVYFVRILTVGTAVPVTMTVGDKTTIVQAID